MQRGTLPYLLQAFVYAHATRVSQNPLSFLVPLLCFVGTLVNGAYVCTHKKWAFRVPMTNYQLIIQPSGAGKVRDPSHVSISAD